MGHSLIARSELSSEVGTNTAARLDPGVLLDGSSVRAVTSEHGSPGGAPAVEAARSSCGEDMRRDGLKPLEALLSERWQGSSDRAHHLAVSA